MVSPVGSRANNLATDANPGPLGSEQGLTETKVDGLACQFLDSVYGSGHYANWPLDRRLESFLEHRGLSHLADNGDLFTIIYDHVMANISCQRWHVGSIGEPRARQSAHR
jgi:hypothetical protein